MSNLNKLNNNTVRNNAKTLIRDFMSLESTRWFLGISTIPMAIGGLLFGIKSVKYPLINTMDYLEQKYREHGPFSEPTKSVIYGGFSVGSFYTVHKIMQHLKKF